jgi:hypothetical protein
MHRSGTLKAQKVLSLAVLAAGVLLTGMMIHAESEPGAIPLMLVLLGAAGYVAALLRARG